MDFKNKVVIITGASSGLGAETAIHFARREAKLVLVGRNKINLEQVATLCEKEKGIKALPIIADVSKEDHVKRIIEETVSKFHKIHVLVNNAAVAIVTNIKDASLEAYDEIMNVNLRGVYHLTSLAVPHLMKTKGCIVNISSIASMKTFSQLSVYCMTKAALDQFTKCIAADLRADGIRVNAINPGIIKTDILRKVFLKEDELNKFIQQNVSATALGKLAEPCDVAALVLFLASDEAKSITGCCYPVDSGILLS